jgi:hypothetical protein
MGFLTRQCPHCGARVRRASNFCPSCGQPAPSRAVVCGRCRRSNAADAKFCAHCGAELARHGKATVVDNRWSRAAGEFAVVLEVDDLNGVLSKTLVVEPGTRALLFRADGLIGVLDPGEHTVDSLPRRIATFGRDTPTLAVLVSSDDTAIELDLPEAWTADEQAVSVKVFLVVRLVDPDAFRRELVRDRWRVLLDDVRALWRAEGVPVVAEIVRRETLESLCARPGLREAVERELRAELESTCARSGLELVQLRCLDFYGSAYETLRAERGEAFQLTRALDVYRRVHDELSTQRIARFQSEHEFEQFVHEAEHRAGLKALLRQQEIEDFKRAYRERMALDKARRDIEQGAIAFESELEKQKALDELRWAKRERGLELLEKLRELRHRERLRRIETDELRLDLYNRATVEALIAILDDERGDRLVELKKFQEQTKMSPEQLLALVAANSPEAALALAERYRAESAISPETYAAACDRITGASARASEPAEDAPSDYAEPYEETE